MAQNAAPQNPTAPAAPVGAQVPATQGAPNVPGQTAIPAQPAPQGPPGTPGSNSAVGLDYMYNRKPQEGSLAKQASETGARADDHAKAADALGLTRVQDPQQRAHFESYLGVPEVTPADFQAYTAQIGKVSALLKQNQVFEAWKQLHALATFGKIDAGVSGELANRIEAVWNTDRTTAGIGNKNQELAQDVRTSAQNADSRAASMQKEEYLWKQRNAQLQRTKQQSNGQQQNGQANGVPGASKADASTNPTTGLNGLEGKLEMTEDYLQTLEAKAKIKLNDIKVEKLFDAAKSDFAGYIQTLSTSHRHQHVILAADFYREIFNESEYPVDVANQVNASLEVTRQAENAIEGFNYKLGRNELSGATDRLEEAFFASEFNPAVLGVPRSQKERIADFLSRLDRMESLIEAHDFGPLETLLNETKALAADFDAIKPLAIVNAVKLESKLRLGKAKLAAQQGDLKAAMEEFQAAAEAWPANPALQDSAGTFFDTQDVKTQSLTEFDRLLADQNFRAIFDKQLAFAPAIHGDTKREEALKGVLEKIKNAEIAYQKATLMRNAGDVCGAWETIEQAATDLPNDNKLNMLRAELSGQGAEFVSAINKAKDAENRHELGYCLSCYAVAQHYYPASTLANAGLQRVAQQVLNTQH